MPSQPTQTPPRGLASKAPRSRTRARAPWPSFPPASQPSPESRGFPRRPCPSSSRGARPRN
eukprot:8447439-Alexandrium_andersonii.AAC.1